MSEPVVHAEGLNGYSQLWKADWFRQVRVVIHKRGSLGQGAKSKIIALYQIGAIEFEAAGLEMGHIRFVCRGMAPDNDENEMVFTTEQQPEFDKLKSAVEKHLPAISQPQASVTEAVLWSEQPPTSPPAPTPHRKRRQRLPRDEVLADSDTAATPSRASKARGKVYCSSCGTKIAKNATFCPSCGDRVAGNAADDTEEEEAVTVGQPYFRYIAMAGGALVIIGSFLPWIKAYTAFGGLSRTGIEDGGDGILTLIFGVLIVVSALIDVRKPKSRALLAVAFSVAVLILGFVDLSSISDRINSVNSQWVRGSIGEGIYVVIVGGIFGLAGVFPNSGPEP